MKYCSWNRCDGRSSVYMDGKIIDMEVVGKMLNNKDISKAEMDDLFEKRIFFQE